MPFSPFRALRVALFAAALFVQGALFAVPAMAQSTMDAGATQFPCFLQSECLQGPATSGTCNDKFCFEAGTGGCVAPQGLCYGNPPPTNLAVDIGGVFQVRNIGEYVQLVYRYGVSIAGLVAAVTGVIGGFQIMTGNAKEGKRKISRSLLGIVLVLGSYVILATINPALVSLELPKVPLVKKQIVASCAATELCHPCGVPYYALERRDGTDDPQADPCTLTALVSENSNSLQATYQIAGECIGKGCGADTVKGGKTCSDATFRCNTVTASSDGSFQCGVKPTAAKDGYACKQCKPDGQSCGRTGANDECCGGLCNEGTCSSGRPGDDCSDDKQCITGICQSNWGNSCSSGAVGSPCADTSECANGNKCSTTGSNVCTPGTQYSYCDNDSECTGGLKCLTSTWFQKNICMPDGATRVSCNSNAECAGKGGFCNTYGGNFCTNGMPGVPCDEDGECANKKCDKGNQMCVTGENGGSCGDNGDCLSGRCFGTGDFSVCVSGLKGSKCDGQAKCASGFACKNARCVAK